MRLTTWLVALATWLTIGCSSQHTSGPGNPSLGQVAITGPSDPSVPSTLGKLSVEDAAVLIGAPFIGPTSPVLVMPSNANGVVTVQFTSNSQSTVVAQLGLTVGAYAFNFQTTDITGSIAGGVTINYSGLHYGENGSCTTWTASSIVLTQRVAPEFDTLAGNYEATCHNSQNAKDGDRGTFLLKRTGTKVPPPVDVCPNIEGVQATIPIGMIKNEQGNCVTPPPPPCVFTVSPLVFNLSHSAHTHQGVTVSTSPEHCAPSAWTAVSNKDWINHISLVPGGFEFKVDENNDMTVCPSNDHNHCTPEPVDRTGTITVAGQTITVNQDKGQQSNH